MVAALECAEKPLGVHAFARAGLFTTRVAKKPLRGDEFTGSSFRVGFYSKNSNCEGWSNLCVRKTLHLEVKGAYASSPGGHFLLLEIVQLRQLATPNQLTFLAFRGSLCDICHIVSERP